MVDEHRQRFDEVMQRLEIGDPAFVLVSCEDDFKYDRNEHRTWFVFEKDLYERCGKRIWDRDFEDVMMSDYIRFAVRFRLRKNIDAKKSEVPQGITSLVRKNIQDV